MSVVLDLSGIASMSPLYRRPAVVAAPDPAEGDPAVAEALAALGGAERAHQALLDRLGDGDETATPAGVREAEDAVTVARARLGALRRAARTRRQREADAQLPALEAEIAAVHALVPQVEAASKRRQMGADDEARLLGEMNARVAAVEATLRALSDVYPSSAEGPVEYRTARLGYGVRVSGASYCRQSPLTVPGGYIPYNPPDLAPAPPPRPDPVPACSSLLAAGYGGKHVREERRDPWTAKTVGFYCINCGQDLA